MRNYANIEKTAIIRNLYTGREFEALFPMDEDKLDALEERATMNGMHDCIVCEAEGFYDLVSDFCSLEELNDIAERLERLEDEDADKLEAMAEYCDDLDDVERVWDDSCFIPGTTLADYAEEFCCECGYMPVDGLPGWISCHIDWEGVGRELSYDGYSEINGGVLYVAQ